VKSPNTATALLSALRVSREHGGPDAALRAIGMELPETGRFEGLAGELEELLGCSSLEKRVSDALALGLLAGRVDQRPRVRKAGDPTSFVMDHDLMVRTAEGESIFRLPWFDHGLFVGRQLPEISEIPPAVRTLAVDNYRAALSGERAHYAFTSYGHAFSVEAVPMRGYDGSIEAVLAIATPGRSSAPATTAYQRTAERLDRAAAHAEQRAALHRLAGRGDAALAESEAAEKARQAAERAKANAQRLRLCAAESADAPALTPRETEVLRLASHGLTYAETAQQLAVSVSTVRTHLENIYPKLGVSDKAAAVAAGLRHGLID
jgi:DNA-binding CsgD family transcriptional regulator